MWDLGDSLLRRIETDITDHFFRIQLKKGLKLIEDSLLRRIETQHSKASLAPLLLGELIEDSLLRRIETDITDHFFRIQLKKGLKLIEDFLLRRIVERAMGRDFYRSLIFISLDLIKLWMQRNPDLSGRRNAEFVIFLAKKDGDNARDCGGGMAEANLIEDSLLRRIETNTPGVGVVTTSAYRRFLAKKDGDKTH